MSPESPRRRRATILAKFALLVLSLLLVAALAEIALRLSEQEPVGGSPATWDESLPTLRSVFDLGKPNQNGIFKGVPFRTNSFGIRGPEIARAKPAGTVRVAVMGDSLTMGSGVLEEDAYPTRLEVLLGASLHPRPVQVINLGISGLNLSVSLARLRRIGLQFDPDYVVYGWTINDLEGKDYRMQRRTKPFQSLEASGSRLVGWLGERLSATIPSIYLLPGSYLAELDDNYFHNPQVWSRFEADLDQLARLNRQRGVCGAVFLHGVLNSLGSFHPFDRFYDEVAAAASERGLFVISSIDRLRGLDERELWVNPLDSHPNAEGHRLLAESLHDGLIDLPPKCHPAHPRADSRP